MSIDEVYGATGPVILPDFTSKDVPCKLSEYVPSGRVVAMSIADLWE